MTNLIQIIKKGEDSKTQFKKQFNSVDSLAAEISAMANTQGGMILVGVSDNGEITGVENLQRLNQMISNACSQKTEPPLSVITENILYEDKIILIINVPQGSDKPYAVNKSDFWIKVGADKRRASREELRRLMQSSHALYADETPVSDTNIENLDMYLFRQFYEETYGMSIEETGIPIENILANLKLAKDGKLTLSGLLIFGKYSEIIKPQYIIKAVAFAGDDLGVSEYLDSEDINYPLFSAFKNGMAFLKRNLRKIQKNQPFNTLGISEIPETALEEAYVNALIHRDYFINSGIRLFVFDSRVEIISPGRLPNNVTVESMKYGIQIVRNPILLSFANKVKIPYRGIGSGVRRMIGECRKADIPEPEFIENNDAEIFTVVFFKKN